MQKSLIRMFSFILLVMLFVPSFTVNAAVLSDLDNVPYSSYSYWYDTGVERKAVYTKPMFETYMAVDYNYIGIDENFEGITDIYSTNESVYILDGKSSKVVVLDDAYQFVSQFDSVSGIKESNTFSGAKGIFVDKDGLIYISDTQNQRVLVTDSYGNYKKAYALPDSKLVPDDFKFKPIKSVIDSSGYLYVLSDGSYYGALMYSPENKFLGFYGANNVKSSFADILKNFWNKLTATNEKRKALEKSLPYQFTDMIVTDDNFIYTITGNTNGKEVKKQSGQIRKINPGGSNVFNSDDIDFSDGSLTKNQDLLGISVDSNGFIYALDSTYGHILVFDKNRNCLQVFGSGSRAGIQTGTFTDAVAISLRGNDILVADSANKNITIFRPTEYGKTVLMAQKMTNGGDYSKASSLWKTVISSDTQNQLAYRGLAKYYYEKNDYYKALEYAKIGFDTDTYALAYGNIRNEFITNHFALLLSILVALIVLIALVAKYLKKIKILNKKSRLALSVLTHPGNSFYTIRADKDTSITVALFFLIVFFVSYIMKFTNGGFCFVVTDSSSFNTLFVLVRSVGLIALFTLCYFGVSSIMSGQNSLSDVFVVVCYSIQPMIIANFLWIILTNLLLPSEIAFLDYLMVAAMLYSAFILIKGLMLFSDYEFGKFVKVLLISVVGMAAVLFLGIVVFLLLQLLWGFVSTVISETYKIIAFGG